MVVECRVRERPQVTSRLGEDVIFTFTVSNNGGVAFEVVSLEDDVYGPLGGDADCQVGTVLQPSASCSFAEASPRTSGTLDQSDPDQVLPDHENTFQGCSVLASGQARARSRLAGDRPRERHVVIVFKKTEVAGVDTVPPTDMLLDTSQGGGREGSTPWLPWIAFTLLAAVVILGGGFVIRGSRHTGV